MGAWTYVCPRIETSLKESSGQRPRYVGRTPSAATATGLKLQLKKETKQFLAEAMARFNFFKKYIKSKPSKALFLKINI